MKHPSETDQEDFVATALADISKLNIDDFVTIDDNAALTWDIRPLSQIEEFLNKVLVRKNTARSEYSVWFTVKGKDAVEGTIRSYEDDILKAVISFKDNQLVKGDTIMLVVNKGNNPSSTPLQLKNAFKNEITGLFDLSRAG